MIRIPLFIFAILFSNLLTAQHLKPGFDKQEYIELLKIGSRTTADTNLHRGVPAPEHSRMIYQSAPIGLDNLWQLWMRDDSVPIISIRGTTTTLISFVANFYAAMVPAKGELHLSDDFIFPYDLSDNPKAAVHVGYLISTAFLSRDILPKIDSLYKAGSKEFIIAGHSQGGAITYLLTSYLENLKVQKKLPEDIRFKTSSSASPKAGNLYYAYSYENLTRGGWAYNVVSTADWVPEVPFSIQTMDDLNVVNPFVNAKQLLKKQKFPKDLVLRHVYNRLNKVPQKARKNYEKYLGKMVGKIIKKALPGFEPPAYFPSSNYVRIGNTIVLYADSAYYKKFPQDVNKVWMNHGQTQYLFLTDRLPDNSDEMNRADAHLSGTWRLTYITGPRIAFDGLYPEKKPEIIINVSKNEVNGNTSCNSFNGKLKANGNKISFTEPMAMTMMACPDEGENVFLQTLKKIKTYSVTDNNNSLTFFVEDIPFMKFVRVLQ